MLSTGHRGHSIVVDWTFGSDVSIDIKGPVLTGSFSIARDNAPRWADAPLDWASARIDLAIETHAHTYSSLTVACLVCKSGAVRTIAMRPEYVALLERGVDEMLSRADTETFAKMLAEVRRG